MATITTLEAKQPTATLTSGRLPNWAPWGLLALSMTIAAGLMLASAGASDREFNIVGSVALGMVIYLVAIYVVSRVVENKRIATDRFMTGLVSTAFVIATLPLVSVLWTVITKGLGRFDGRFFSESMRNILDDGGGAVHAIWGTILITLVAALISVPIGLMTSIYLVEYGNGKPLAKAITFFVDVMTGIPSIVAGLFIYAVFSLIFGPGIRMGFMGALALTVLMIPVVVRGSEEMLRIVPNELREASYALAVPKWRTVLKVVLPTSIAGIMTSVTLAIARVIGETAPLLLTAGFVAGMNLNMFEGPMSTLPVFVYTQYAFPGTPPDPFIARAWAGALTLVLIVMALNLIARLIAKAFAPKMTGR